MKCFVISDNADTRMGMRLAGVDGIVVQKRDEVMAALSDVTARGDIAVVFITKKLIELCGSEIDELKLTLRKPLIVEIPDRHGDSHISETISRYVSEAVGIKI